MFYNSLAHAHYNTPSEQSTLQAHRLSILHSESNVEGVLMFFALALWEQVSCWPIISGRKDRIA